MLTYYGKNSECGQKGMILISTPKANLINPTLMKLSYIQENILLGDECNSVAQQIMPPKGGVMLTK